MFLLKYPHIQAHTCSPIITKKCSGTITYIWQAKNKIMDIRILSSFLNLCLADQTVVVSILDVLSNGAVEQDGFLRHQTQLRAQPSKVQFLCVHPVH